MITNAACCPPRADVKEQPQKLVYALSSKIIDSAIDAHRRRIYVAPKSPSCAGDLLRSAANWESWRLQLVKHIPVTSAGAVDFERLAAYPFVDEHLVQACQTTLPDQSQSVAIVREYWEPKKLLLEREEYLDRSQTPAAAVGEIPAGELETLPRAYARGPELRWSGPNHATLVEALGFQAVGTAGITYIQGGRERFESYGELLSAARRVLYGLQKLGLRKGDPLPLQITDRRQHFHVFWGCALGGIIPVTIAVPPRYETDNPVFQKLVGVWKLLGGRYIMSSTGNVGPLKKLLHRDAIICDVADLDLSGEGEEAALAHDDILFYQLTSGSTGTPKCIPETHAAIISHIKHSAVHVGYSANDRTLNWLPFDHVVPMLTFHLKDVYLGCRPYQVPTAEVLAEPLLWLDLMEKHRINYSWSPNFGFKLVSTAAKKKQTDAMGVRLSWDLRCVKRLMNAGEQVTASVCDDFLRVTNVPAEVIQPAFGMAEVATCMTYANDYGGPSSVFRVLKSTLQGVLREADDTATECEVLPLVDLGPPSPGVEIRITDRGSDQVLRENQVGHLQIRGPCVMQGYYNNPQANAESFIGDAWFDSGDLGFITNGRLVLTGRAKEMIIVRGANFYAYEIEDNVAELQGCMSAFVAATSIHSEASGTEGLLIFFVPDPAVVPDLALRNLSHGFLDPTLKQVVTHIHSHVASSFGVNPHFVIPVPKSGFLKTTSGKIQRNAFRKRFLEGTWRDVCKTLRRALSQHGRCVPDWFCKTVWQRRNKTVGAEISGGGTAADNVFVFQPVTLDLASELEASQAFLSPDKDSLDRLRVMIDGSKNRLARVIYAQACNPSEACADADYCAGLIALGQALGEVRNDVELYVITRGAFQVASDDASTPECLARTVCLSGIAKALSAELPCIKKSVHLDVDDDLIATPGALSAALQSEMANQTADPELAIRRGVRYVKRYTRAGESLASEIASTPQNAQGYFRPGGAYVVTGGLGGIGVGIVKKILEVEGTAVLIIGRRVDVSKQLAKLGWQGVGDGSRVSYCAVELGQDADQLEQRVQDFLDGCGKPLAGIIHLAGHFERTAVSELSDVAFQNAIRAKVQGSIHLHRVLKSLHKTNEKPQFLHFGSVASLFAGQGLASYSAACTFQEEFSIFQRTDGVESRVFSWSIWEDTGVGARDRSLGFAPWVCPLSKSQGLAVFETLVNFTSQLAVYIGVNVAHPELGRLSADCDDVDYHSLCVFHTSEARLDFARTERAVGSVNYLCVPQIPVAQGGVNRKILRTATIKSLAASEQAGPQGRIEEALFTIWKDVLGIASLDRQDNFFELGGDSLSWMEMANRMYNSLDLQVDGAQIMQHGTVAELADYAARQKAAVADAPDLRATSPSSNLLVTLKKGSNPALAPVFLFPTIAGTTSCFNQLLSHVNARCPVVGISDPYLRGDRLSRLLPFDEWMQRFADAIQSLQPAGPYTLISYSQGSTWLWGTAEQLIRRGEVVERCILLDPFFPAWSGCEQGFDWLAKWVSTIYRRVPRFVLRMAIARVMSHMFGLDGAMQTERQREVSLAKAYERYTSYRENIWLYVLFMEMDTGIRIVEHYRQLKHFPRDEYGDAVEFLCRRSAAKLNGKVELQYLKDVLHVMAYAFLRASTYRPTVLPDATEVVVVAPKRKGMSLAKETKLDRLIAPGRLREIDVTLEEFDKSRHVTGKLRRLYRPFELHYRCMHDARFIAECTKVFQSVGISD